MERTRRRFWTFAVTTGAVLVILAAAASAAFRLAVQAVPGYRAKVEGQVRELTGQQIRIGDLALTWRYYYPSLDLNGVALLGPDGETPVLEAERLRLGFGLTRLLRGDTTPNRLELQGLRIDARIDRDGRVSVQGIETSGGGTTDLEALQPLTRFSRVRLERCRMNLRDERRGDEVWSFGIERATLDRGLLGDVLSVNLALPATLGDSARLDLFFNGELLQPSTWSGTISGALKGLVAQTWLQDALMPGATLEAADTEVVVHGALQAGRLKSARLDLRSGSVRGRRARHEAALEQLDAHVELDRFDDGWHARVKPLAVRVAGSRWSADAEVKVERDAASPPTYDVSATFLRIADLAPWLQIVVVPPALARLSAASGQVEDLQLRVQPDTEGAAEGARYSFRARFDELGLPATQHPAGFGGLRGEVAGDERGGRAVLQEGPATIELPGKLATPQVPLEALEAEVEWRRHGGGWSFGMPQFRWRLWGIRGKGRFAITPAAQEGGSPVMDLAAQFSAEDVTRAKPLMPRAWSDGLRSWLDRSIVAGRATRADLVIQGPLADFPFHRNPTGRWTLDIDTQNADLQYLPDWPPVNDIQAHLHFEGNGLSIEASRGLVAGNPVEGATARFPDFSTGQLLIDATTRGEIARYYEFLKHSPLRETLKGLLEQTTAAGPAQVEVRLDIPLKEAAKTQVAGNVGVEGVELRHSGLAEPIRDVRGQIAFTGTGAITAEGLTAQLYGEPVRGAIAPQAGGGSLLTASVRATIDPAGQGASELIPAWLRKRASGASAWRATLALADPSDLPLRLESDLVGVALDYPPPLGKTKEQALPLALSIGREAKAPLRIAVDAGDRLAADLRFARKRGVMELARGVLRLGDGATPQATEPGLMLTGDLPEIDVEQWVGALQAAGLGPATGQAIRRADLRVKLARWSPFALRDVRYQWSGSRNGWTLQLSGANGAGEVKWSAAERGLVTARLDALSVGYAPAEASLESGEAIDPGALPLFDLDVKKLVVGQAELGHVVLATIRTDAGQKTRVLKADGGMVTLSADAEWRRRAGQSSGSLSGDLSATRFGTLLKAFGYAPNLDARTARFRTAVSWLPSERGIEWEQAQGTVHLEFDNGQLRAVEPGAGRVLGLVNFYALPRRLALNFRDVLGSGLGFDKIRGDFEMRDGSATTQNLSVLGPSVRMDVRGRIGLAARDYDQEVTVYPDVSSGVTLGAVLLGGPVAGALTLIAQQIMDKPLNQVTQLSYRVTGSWDNPQVTRGSGSRAVAPEGAPAPESAPAAAKKK